ncbi:hypothetical protein AG0111_0g12369 [Alternaria gaisen]|uniref:Uncharacterized protein n=1 Tax=Alternaria gaisen TaxID=167740 RepID=A0ACB6F4Y9_9PLEO|nr:hypothetical protein AG0111_0g12369 [Alternaria gaisen]
MPTYFARGVSVRLSATPLEDSTTQKIILRKGDAAKQQSELAERRLLERKLLKEVVVPFPDDEYAFQLNWVANAPFMQTRVKNSVYDKTEAMTGTHLVHIPDNITAVDHSFTDAGSHSEPKALALHVNLSDKTYVSGLYNQRTSLKIEVFFNGTLSACLFIPTHDVRSGAKSNYQVFGGTRIDFLAERPWVILSPEVAADGSTRKNTTAVSVEQRWLHLCRALQIEARERGQDEEGNKPPTADFLCALATMQMPDQVRNMQKPGGKTFGIIDVIITAGEGRKLTSGVGYLKAPKRMVDGSYPFVPDADSTTMRLRIDTPGKSESDAEPQNSTQSSSEVIDVDAEGDSDPDYDFHSKRQALQPRVRLTQDIPHVPSSALQHPVMGPLIPFIPPPLHAEPKTTVLQAPEITVPDLPWSSGLARVHAQAHEQEKAYEQQVDITSQAGLGPKMMYPDIFPCLQTPQMRLSPYVVQFSDPTLGGIMPSDLMRQIPFDNDAQSSSPLSRFPMNLQGPGHSAVSSFPALIPHESSRSGLYAYSSSNQPCSNFPNTHFSLPNYNMSGTGPSFAGRSEVYKPNMLPQATAFAGLQKYTPPQVPFPPFDRRLSLPLPPAALYSVPTKPKRSLSPQKASSSQKTKKAKSSIKVKRLVVHGQKGSILVDHRWDPVQHIGVSLNSPAKLGTQETVTHGDKEHANPVEQGRTFTGTSRTRKSSVRKGTPAPASSSEHENPDLSMAADKHQPISAFQANALTGQHAVNAKKSKLKHEPEKVAKARYESDQPGTDMSNQNLRVTKERSSRRTTSSNGILGVQGPKANPIWFEDPEEILREASARLRRCRPSKKYGNASDVAVLPNTVVLAVQTPKAWDTDTSSPLSSLHTTPEPEMEPTTYTSLPQAPVESSPARIPQADGSPERKTTPKRRRGNHIPSPMKLASTSATPQLSLHNPFSSQSSALKERKITHRTLPKEPRSPDRLKTNDNPPLNRDCVIAYAESKDKKNKQGILRQVKSERLGVFTESDVVFAARFFVED